MRNLSLTDHKPTSWSLGCSVCFVIALTVKHFCLRFLQCSKTGSGSAFYLFACAIFLIWNVSYSSFTVEQGTCAAYLSLRMIRPTPLLIVHLFIALTHFPARSNLFLYSQKFLVLLKAE